MKTSAKVPATIANLGCGFDSFGIALPIFNTITIEETVMPGSGIQINILTDDPQTSTSNIPTDKTSIVYKAINMLYGFLGQTPDDLRIDIKTQIPVARGLGSSSSVIVGALVAANELLGHPADTPVLLSIATEIEGHPDNVTTALVGGMTISSQEEDGSVLYRKLNWPKEWKLTVAIPDFELATDIARSVLPECVPMKDAIFNLKRTAMFVEAINTKDEELMAHALKDKIHQPYREKLVTGLFDIANNLKHTKSVMGTVLCGAGPSILVVSNGTNLSEIKDIIYSTWDEMSIKSNILTLPVEENGATII